MVFPSSLFLIINLIKLEPFTYIDIQIITFTLQCFDFSFFCFVDLWWLVCHPNCKTYIFCSFCQTVITFWFRLQPLVNFESSVTRCYSSMTRRCVEPLEAGLCHILFTSCKLLTKCKHKLFATSR